MSQADMSLRVALLTPMELCFPTVDELSEELLVPDDLAVLELQEFCWPTDADPWMGAAEPPKLIVPVTWPDNTDKLVICVSGSLGT